MKNEIKIFIDSATGKKKVLLPAVFNIPAPDQRICELAEQGFTLETISVRCRVKESVVRGVLDSESGSGYREYLSVQRELDWEDTGWTWDMMISKATHVLENALSDDDVKVRLAASKEVLDRDPSKNFVKTRREERVISGGNFDASVETKRVEALVTKHTGLLSAPC